MVLLLSGVADGCTTTAVWLDFIMRLRGRLIVYVIYRGPDLEVQLLRNLTLSLVPVV